MTQFCRFQLKFYDHSLLPVGLLTPTNPLKTMVPEAVLAPEGSHFYLGDVSYLERGPPTPQPHFLFISKQQEDKWKGP